MTPIIKAKKSYFNIRKAKEEESKKIFVLKEKERGTGKEDHRL
jgi:hypothetical protein